MDGATSLLALGPALVVLALVDSLSIGTLAVPVWLMLAPGRPRAQRILFYLFVLAVFYLVVGLVLLGGADALVSGVDLDWESPAASRVLFFCGAALLAASFVVDPPGGSTGRRGGTRLARWRAAATGTDEPEPGGGDRHVGVAARTRRSAPTRSLVGLAMGVGLIEVGTMLPYLAAIGLLTSTERPLVVKAVMLAGYCLVMVLPALLLLAGRTVAARVLDPLLQRIDRWFSEHGGEAMGWILGIIGVVLMGRNLPAVMDLVNGI